MHYVAITCLAVLALAGAAFGQERPILRYSLENGLDVVLVPDHRVPKVVVDLSCRVGSMNEPPGRSGFAHLFEHLMFAGTPAYPDIDAIYGAEGIGLNAYTYEDRTLYYAEGMASTLPLILSVEADRMANQGAAITHEDLDLQRAVVLNEMRQNTLDTVNGSGVTALNAALFPAPHPYSRAVIGSMADIAAATFADVKSFFDAYYAPNNAILVVVGDFDPVQAQAMIADTFGRIPRGADVPQPPILPVPPARVRLEMEDRVPTPGLMLGWAVPPIQEKSMRLLRLVEELMDNPDYGVLRRELIDTGLASEAYVDVVEPGYLGSRFVVQASAAEGADIAELEAATHAAVASFLATPIDPDDLERARKRIIISDRIANETLRTLADNVAFFTEVMDDPAFAIADDPYIVAATPEEVIATARASLVPGDASVLITRPGNRRTYPEVLTRSSGIPEPLAATSRPPVEIPQLAVGTPATPRLPVAARATLSNGIEIVHYELPTAPVFYLVAASKGGTRVDPPGKEGAVELALNLAIRGAGGLDPVAYGQALGDLGAEISAEIYPMQSFISMSAAPDVFADAVPLFADAVLRPGFDRAEWRVLVSETLNELGYREADLDDVASRYGEAAVFPQPAGMPAIDKSLRSVRALKLDDIKVIFPRLFTPANTQLISIGPVPLETVVAQLEKQFGGWTSDAVPLVSEPRPPVVFPATPKVLVVPEPGASQSSIWVATPAPGYGDPRRAESDVVLNLLALEFISRINAVIREEKGYTYGTDGYITSSVHNGSIMVVQAPVERDVTGAALTDIFAGFESLAAEPVRADELRRSSVAAQARLAGMGETITGLYDDIWRAGGLGSSLEDEFARRLRLTTLTLDEVRRQAAAMSSLDEALIVVVGDPAIVKPQLDALGLPVEVVERNL